MSSEVKIKLSKEDAYFIPSSLISLDNEGKIGIKVVKEAKVNFLIIEIISDTGKTGLIPVRMKFLKYFNYLITQGHEYVTEGENVIIENLNDR